MLAGSRELNVFEQLDQPGDHFVEIVITGRHRLSFESARSSALGLGLAIPPSATDAATRLRRGRERERTLPVILRIGTSTPPGSGSLHPAPVQWRGGRPSASAWRHRIPLQRNLRCCAPRKSEPSSLLREVR